ncbi:MAG: Rid family hydrolase [Naasia sp.]
MPPTIRLVRSAELSSAPYAYASVVDSAARIVFLAGACPLERDGTTAAVGDYEAQAAKCIETLTEALEAAGATLRDVVSTRVLVASSRQADLVTAWNVVRSAFGEHDVPSTLMGVTVLGYDDQLVEIEAIAALSD